MADNTIIQAPTANGDTISTEDIGGGLKLPRSKLVIGVHGTDSGDVSSSNPMPITGVITSAIPAGSNTIGNVGLVAGSAVVGKVSIDQTTPGTTNLVAADITKVAGSAIAQGHGVAATAIRVELPTDGTGLVNSKIQDGTGNALTSLVAGAQRSLTVAVVDASGNQITSFGGGGGGGTVQIDQTTQGTTNGVQLKAGSAIAGKFTTDQTLHGTTDLVAADITQVGGTALALGQALAAASIPVVLPAATVTTLTPLSTVAVTQATGSNLHTVVDSGTITTVSAVTGITNALPVGSNTIGNVGLVAGSAVVGKVSIDQTTPGTTNLVAADITKVAGSAIAQGNGLAASAIRVTLPTDGTGLVNVKNQDGSGNALTSLSLGAQRSLTVAVVDASGNQITSFGGGGGGGSTVAIDQTTSGTTNAVFLLATENHIGEVGGRKAVVSSVFTRPANTTAYVAGYAVSNSVSATTPMTLTGAARKTGGSGYITGIRLSTNLKSINPRFRVRFWNNSAPTMSADGAAFQAKYADESKRIGMIDLVSMSTPSDTTNSDISSSFDYTIRIPFLTVGSADIYATLETLDAFTPASGQSFTLAITTDQD